MYDDYDRPTRCAVLSYYRGVDDPNGLGRAQSAALRPRNVPALVIWGRHDPYLSTELAYRQREAFPDAEIHIFEQSGHWPFIDAAERTRRLVVPFLRRALRHRLRG